MPSRLQLACSVGLIRRWSLCHCRQALIQSSTMSSTKWRNVLQWPVSYWPPTMTVVAMQLHIAAVSKHSRTHQHQYQGQHILQHCSSAESSVLKRSQCALPSPMIPTDTSGLSRLERGSICWSQRQLIVQQQQQQQHSPQLAMVMHIGPIQACGCRHVLLTPLCMTVSQLMLMHS